MPTRDRARGTLLMAIRPLELTTGYTLHSQSGQPQASLPKGLWEPWLAQSVPCAQLWGTGTSQPQPLSAPGLSAIRSLHLCPDPHTATPPPQGCPPWVAL